MKLMTGNCLEGSAHTHMYNPHILPLIKDKITIFSSRTPRLGACSEKSQALIG